MNEPIGVKGLNKTLIVIRIAVCGWSEEMGSLFQTALIARYFGYLDNRLSVRLGSDS